MQLIGGAKNGIAALELRRQLDVSYPTAWMNIELSLNGDITTTQPASSKRR